jgi:hypothetical protein
MPLPGRTWERVSADFADSDRLLGGNLAVLYATDFVPLARIASSGRAVAIGARSQLIEDRD